MSTVQPSPCNQASSLSFRSKSSLSSINGIPGSLIKQQPLDACNLYVKNLWKNCNQVDLDDLFKPHGIIIQSRIYEDGVGFVKFENAFQASTAIKALNGKKIGQCSEPLVVKYAYKKSHVPKSVIKFEDKEIEMTMHDNNKNVYIRGLPMHYHEIDLYSLCSPYGKINCLKLSANHEFGFVRFSLAQEAQNCIHGLHLTVLPLSKSPLLVKLANKDPFESRVKFIPKNDGAKTKMTSPSSAPATNSQDRNVSENDQIQYPRTSGSSSQNISFVPMSQISQDAFSSIVNELSNFTNRNSQKHNNNGLPLYPLNSYSSKPTPDVPPTGYLPNSQNFGLNSLVRISPYVAISPSYLPRNY